MATSFEKKLDKDFWYYLTLAKEVYENFSTDDEKNSCEVRHFPFYFFWFFVIVQFFKFSQTQILQLSRKALFY